MSRAQRIAALSAAMFALAATSAPAYSLWSSAEGEPGAGEIHLEDESRALGELRVRNLLLVGPSNWIVPFNNGGASAPRSCAAPPPIERRNNENIDTCPVALAHGELSLFVIEGGPHQGNQIATITPSGELSMSADVVLRFAQALSAPQPLFATTGRIALPDELKRRAGDIVQRMPWMAAGEGALRGRLGDFNANGWIDGTLVTVGTLPAAPGGGPARHYLMIRHFETDLPASGVHSGDVAALARSSAASRARRTD